MMMITKQISHSPYYTDTPSMAFTATMAAFDTHYQQILPCPVLAVTAKVVSPRAAPTEPSPSKKRRCSRKVDFGPDMTLAYIESAVEFTQAEKDERWYRPSEISSFRGDARKLCKTRMDDIRNISEGVSIPDSSTGNEKSVIPSSTDSIRGLDVYYPSRQRYGKKYIGHVLEAYYVRCVGNDEHVALLAEKWSKKNLNRAIRTGKKDFLAAYSSEEDDSDSLPEETVVLASTLPHSPKQNDERKILATSARKIAQK